MRRTTHKLNHSLTTCTSLRARVAHACFFQTQTPSLKISNSFMQQIIEKMTWLADHLHLAEGKSDKEKTEAVYAWIERMKKAVSRCVRHRVTHARTHTHMLGGYTHPCSWGHAG